jgi:CRP-like cAMP-binding protein
MTEPEAAGVSTHHTFLERLGEPHCARLVAVAKRFRCNPGEFLAREGQPASAFYLIESGHVGISSHLGARGELLIQTLAAGDVVGWSWLLPPYLWQFDARAGDAVAGLSLDAAWLRKQCEEDHELGYHVLRQLLEVVSSRLVASRIRHLDIYK